MKIRRAAVVAVLAVALAGCRVGGEERLPEPPGPPLPPRDVPMKFEPAPVQSVLPRPEREGSLQEDDPGWDCSTMGNRLCGPEELPQP